MIWPVLFNLVIFLFIVMMWGFFIMNVIRSAKRNNTRNSTSRTTRTTQTVTRTQRQHSLDRRNERSRNQTSSKKTNQSLQTLLRQNPAELYRTLKEQLPDRYKEELKDIFESPNPAVELIKFLRRKDVWPFIQNLLRQEVSPADSRRMRQSAERTPNPSSAISQEAEMDEGIEEIASASINFEREQEELLVEYDAYGLYFDQLLADVDLGNDTSMPQREERLEARKKKAKVDRKWLEEAMVAKVILDKPDI